MLRVEITKLKVWTNSVSKKDRTFRLNQLSFINPMHKITLENYDQEIFPGFSLPIVFSSFL